jgi:hypothetical protein
MQGAQKLRSEAHSQVRRNDEVAAQRSRWTFYETIKTRQGPLSMSGPLPDDGRYSTLISLFLVSSGFGRVTLKIPAL